MKTFKPQGEELVEEASVILLIIVLFASCVPQKIRTDNYKVTPKGLEVYKKTNGYPTKDVISNGDTLVSTGDSIYIIKCRAK